MIYSYLLYRGLEISPHKTQMTVFSRKKSLPTGCSISLKQYTLKPTNLVRFFGILLDPKLTGKVHIEHITCKARKILQVISALRDVWWVIPSCYSQYIVLSSGVPLNTHARFSDLKIRFAFINSN